MNTKPNTGRRTAPKSVQNRTTKAYKPYKNDPKHQSFLVLPEQVHDLVEMFRCNQLDKEQSGLALMTYLHLRRDGMDEFEASCKIVELYHPELDEAVRAAIAKSNSAHS